MCRSEGSSGVPPRIVGLSPSGFVPGDGTDGRSVELSNGFGGGHDGFSCDLFEILFVNGKDLGVIYFLLGSSM